MDIMDIGGEDSIPVMVFINGVPARCDEGAIVIALRKTDIRAGHSPWSRWSSALTARKIQMGLRFKSFHSSVTSRGAIKSKIVRNTQLFWNKSECFIF